MTTEEILSRSRLLENEIKVSLVKRLLNISINFLISLHFTGITCKNSECETSTMHSLFTILFAMCTYTGVWIYNNYRGILIKYLLVYMGTGPETLSEGCACVSSTLSVNA